MGMDYYIVPDVEADCADDFPAGLSSFFEAAGSGGEYEEVLQVSKILRIDLSMFQQVSFDENEEYVREEDDAEAVWHTVHSISAVTTDLLAKIAAYPEYYKQVLYKPNHEFVNQQVTPKAIVEQLDTLENTPDYYYPTDRGYLSKGRIIEDLKELQQILRCYRDSGVTKLKLTYM